MTEPNEVRGNRLDSWKAIADYLNRDIATVRRWEKGQGLPVRRLPGGRGSSVFAFREEIDEWLRSTPDSRVAAEVVAPSARPIRLASAGVLLITLVLLISWTNFRDPAVNLETMRVEMTGEGLLAFDRSGRNTWKYEWPSGHRVVPLPVVEPVIAVGGDAPGLIAATAFRVRHSDGGGDGGQLFRFSEEGTLLWSFSFADTVILGGKPFGPPWVLTSFAPDDRSRTRRIAVSAHHFAWGTSLAAVLDPDGEPRGLFIHAGWLEDIRWLSPDRLLIGGFSDGKDGGMVALLDPNKLTGQGPEEKGSPQHCDSCPEGRPIRMVIMPRTEVNVWSYSRFNRAVIEIAGDRVRARTVEMPATGQEAVDAIYEFTKSLELIGASFSSRYWEIHDALRAQGRINHSRALCPDQDGPREILVWDAEGGWRTVKAP